MFSINKTPQDFHFVYFFFLGNDFQRQLYLKACIHTAWSLERGGDDDDDCRDVRVDLFVVGVFLELFGVVAFALVAVLLLNGVIFLSERTFLTKAVN